MNINVPTNNGKPELFLACWHDRHTDDKFITFLDEEKSKNQCREWMNTYRTDQVVENQQYGDWCLFLGESYYAFVQKVELVS